MSDSLPSDLSAIRQIVEEHQSAIRAFVSARLDDPFEAHDLAQEVFLIMWKQLDQLDLDQPLRPWLLGVANNLVRKHRRKSRAVPVGGNDEVLNLLDGRSEKIAEATLDGPVFDALDSCLAELGDDARKLVQMRYVDGLDIREIRSQIGGKHSAMTMKLHRLRALLFNCIQGKLKGAPAA